MINVCFLFFKVNVQNILQGGDLGFGIFLMFFQMIFIWFGFEIYCVKLIKIKLARGKQNMEQGKF